MSMLEKLIIRARAGKKKIVLPEGQDPRVIIAANKIMEEDIAKEVIVLGTEQEIDKACEDAGITSREFTTIDYLRAKNIEEYAFIFQNLRAKKGKEITIAQSIEILKSRLYFGAMMVKENVVDGMVSGSISSTSDLLRAAFAVIGTSHGIKTASSAFLMELQKPTSGGEKSLFFADCAVNPDPDPEMLVDIALATAKTHKSLIGTKPKIAFLSFSTKGSAEHPLVKKVRLATSIMKTKIVEMRLDYDVDGEIQLDAAIVPKISLSKAPGSPLEGNANILIFPDLNAGNIGYKLTQRIGNASALGPAMQGLAKPLNDLSRGCSVDDIVGTVAITICQSLD